MAKNKNTANTTPHSDIAENNVFQTVVVAFLQNFVQDIGKTKTGLATEIVIVFRLLLSFFAGSVGKARIMGIVIGGGAIFTLWTAHVENRLPNILLPQLRVENDENLDVNGLSSISGQWQQADSMMNSLYSQEHYIKSGSSLDVTLRRARVPQAQRYALIESLKQVHDPRDLRNGQKIDLRYGGGAGRADPMQLYEMVIPINSIETIRVYREDTDSQDYQVEIIRVPLVKRLNRAEGVIDSSLYMAAMDEGVPVGVLTKMINTFSFDIDFQRQIRKGDTFSLLYERYQDQDTGQTLKTGNILIGEMVVSGKVNRYYRYQDADGIVDYYNKDGVSARRTLMKTPINGARISSGFGKRRHPVLGYNKMHRGVDFAAPRGTPIYAAGSGVIEVAKYYGTYGNYVKIRHRNSYKTVYAHMSRIASGLARGRTVQQGQIIGYVGSTGRSTGPHLHYEIHYDGKSINPAKLKLPKGKSLTGIELENFQKLKKQLENEFVMAKQTSKQ